MHAHLRTCIVCSPPARLTMWWCDAARARGGAALPPPPPPRDAHPTMHACTITARMVRDMGGASVRSDVKQLSKDFDKTEDDLKAVQNAGQIIAEVLKPLDADRRQRAGATRTQQTAGREECITCIIHSPFVSSLLRLSFVVDGVCVQ